MKIGVRFHSGSKGDERPFAIAVDGEERLVVQISKQAVMEDANTGKRKRIFEVMIEDRETYLLEETEGTWKISNLTSPM
jgi:hypothetical protein